MASLAIWSKEDLITDLVIIGKRRQKSKIVFVE